MRNRMLATALLGIAMAGLTPIQTLKATDYVRDLHASYNSRNINGTYSRHKAKMKCKKYCSPKRNK